ncbi:hypothetical protein KC19_VG063000 [Ceratodon purpureus]|uniref:Secreted protein n=1 Tax=Ceratodon purpureus TaxID=3225 RepID=A0A8T0HMH7_CERPU|nr:hypothetical protein KC19_VG063000 [Ceratodon purpureus]
MTMTLIYTHRCIVIILVLYIMDTVAHPNVHSGLVNMVRSLEELLFSLYDKCRDGLHKEMSAKFIWRIRPARRDQSTRLFGYVHFQWKWYLKPDRGM